MDGRTETGPQNPFAFYRRRVVARLATHGRPGRAELADEAAKQRTKRRAMRKITLSRILDNMLRASIETSNNENVELIQPKVKIHKGTEFSI